MFVWGLQRQKTESQTTKQKAAEIHWILLQI